MKPTTTALGLPLWLLAAGLALAPAVRAQEEPERRGRAARMYEDVEVLRRILAGKLQALYSSGSRRAEPADAAVRKGLYDASNTYVTARENLLTSPDGVQRLWRRYYPATVSVNLEGVYLKGQGVVYTVTLPPPARNPVATASGSSQKTPSEWDRVRSEVRGERPAEGEKTPAPKGPSMAEIILRALADNGRHFTRLGADESLTVVVTFRSVSPLGWSELLGDPRFGEVKYYLDRVGKLYPNPNPAGMFEPRPASSAIDYELLGDLHLRQGKVNEAFADYQKAIELKPGSQRTAAICMKIAQGFLLQKREDQARNMIEQGLKLLKKNQDKNGRSDRADGTARLPAKLIVSAPKKLLEQMGAGKISFNEFRKEASVQYLTFPPSAK
jgi:tetratricopeptide (TPR) repeat protein